MTKQTEAPARSALKLALEALYRTESKLGGIAWEREAEAIIAIHEALALVDKVDQEESSGTEQPDMNLSCKSVQARLATSWGYVKAEHPAIKQDLTPEQPDVWVTPKLRPLAKLAHEQQEPVAWPAGLIERIKAAEQRIQDGHAPRRIPADPTDVDLVLAEVRYLLEGKQPPFWVNTSPPAQRKPLTDEEIERIYDRYGGNMMNCARAIERAHGIKGGK